MDIISVDINNINLDDVDFDKDDSEAIVHVKLIGWRKRLKSTVMQIEKVLINDCLRVSKLS